MTSLLLKTLENATKEYARECIRRCAEYYGFESDEALLKLNLEKSVIHVKEMKKRSVAAEPKTKTLKVEVEKVEKVKACCPFPFDTCQISEEGCGGLAYNNGLFTQCQKVKMEHGLYCKGCQKEADASASGFPATGTVAQRVSLGEGFRCPKGRAVVAYGKVMEKLKLSRETVEAEASKYKLTIDEVHFAVVEVEEKKEKKEKAGRPKAEKKKVVSAETVEDLFALLVEEDDEAETVIMTESEEEEEEVDTRELEKSERNMMRSNESETKKVMAHEEKKQKEALRAAEKEKRIAEELAAKEKKVADELAAKEAKKQQMIVEKETARVAKEQKNAEELAAKELKKKQLEDAKQAKVVKKAPTAVAVVVAPVVAVPASTRITVVPITIDGVKYKKSRENILYSEKTATRPAEPVGIYDEATNSIKPLPIEDDDEISEDGSDEDDDDEIKEANYDSE